MELKFSEAQVEVLTRKLIIFQNADSQLKEFIDYLKKEYNVGNDYVVSKDLKGFEKNPNIKQVVEQVVAEKA